MSTHGDWDAWLQYVLEGVRLQADESITLADRLQGLHAEYRGRLQGLGATVNALRLVDQLFITPLVDTRTVRELLGVSNPTARATIRTLEDAGIVSEQPGRSWGKIFTAEEIYSVIRGDDEHLAPAKPLDRTAG